MTALTVIQESKHLFNDALSTTEVTWEKESQFALQALQKNDYLRDVASRATTTLQNSIINVAAIGISLNPALKHAYLVPRDKQVVLDISYMGLLHLAVKTGSILFGQSKLVYVNDEYQ
ncbi:MAG: DNA recombinase, partial [Planctomycetes bacterium]|nr:DNA recombinase [Planctomycetota bacterium]